MIMGFKIAGVNVWGVCCLYGGEQHGDKQGQCGCFLSCLHGSELEEIFAILLFEKKIINISTSNPFFCGLYSHNKNQ